MLSFPFPALEFSQKTRVLNFTK